jgi:hypothetical protein
MPVGNTETDTGFVNDLGFKLTDKITLLGFIISNDGIDSDNMFRTLYTKIGSIITMWDRFKLSLPGRIGISKTLLLSQLSYIGSVCMPEKETLDNLQSLINNYVIGNLKVGKDRLYAAPNKGGLGLINLEHFFLGLQACWVKKAADSTRDNWRVDLHSATAGNCLTANHRTLGIELSHTLRGIVCSYNTFTDPFFRLNSNYLEDFIYNNDRIRRSAGSEYILDNNFFAMNVPRLNMESVSRLKVKDFVSNGNFRSLDEVTLDLSVEFSLLTYMRLREAIMLYVTNCNRRVLDGSKISIEQFLRPKKGNAKRIRNVLDTDKCTKAITHLKPVKTYMRLTDLLIEPERLGNIFGSWNLSFCSNKFREFMFKYLNSSLPVNVRLAHFVANQSRNCHFCTINRIGQPPEETFMHIFFECGTVQQIHNWFWINYFNETVPDWAILKKTTIYRYLCTHRLGSRN